MVLCLTLGVFGLAGLIYAQAPDPDINDDGIVNILDISFVASQVTP